MSGDTEPQEPSPDSAGSRGAPSAGAGRPAGPVWGAYLVFIICFCLVLTAAVVASLIPTSASVLALEALLLLPPLVYVRLRRLPMAEALR